MVLQFVTICLEIQYNSTTILERSFQIVRQSITRILNIFRPVFWKTLKFSPTQYWYPYLSHLQFGRDAIAICS